VEDLCQRGIAAQCPDEGGVAVLYAVQLHRIFTGSDLEIEECFEERSQKKQTPNNLNRIGIYPNPTNGVCRIDYKLEPGQFGNISVRDAFGKQLLIYALDTGGGTIQLEQLPSGMYFVQLLVNSNIIETQKLVKL
jgi:hypothetical protein